MIYHMETYHFKIGCGGVEGERLRSTKNMVGGKGEGEREDTEPTFIFI